MEELKKYVEDRIKYLFNAEAEQLAKIDEHEHQGVRQVYWKLINELAARRHELEELRKTFQQ